jgi:hypothetical protein
MKSAKAKGKASAATGGKRKKGDRPQKMKWARRWVGTSQQSARIYENRLLQQQPTDGNDGDNDYDDYEYYVCLFVCCVCVLAKIKYSSNSLIGRCLSYSACFLCVRAEHVHRAR